MYKFSVPWIFLLDKDYSYNVAKHLPRDWREGYAFVDSKGHRRLEIHPNGDVVVLAGYAWDGCTPKFSFIDIAFGTPDGIPNEKTKKPKAYYASLLHDALYQFIDAQLPLSRSQIDTIFLELMTRDRFAPRRLYFGVVRALGGVFRQFTSRKRKYAGKRVPLCVSVEARPF